jgi:hypothetical protein
MKKRKGKSDGERLDDIERQQAERQQLIEKDHLDDGDVEIQATKKPEFKVGDRVGSPLAGISPRQLRASCLLIKTRMAEGTLPNRHGCRERRINSTCFRIKAIVDHH